MSQEWIKVCKETPDKPEVTAIAAATGSTPEEAFARLIRLWSWADSHTTAGFAKGVTLVWVDSYVRAPGFAEAMCAEGWLASRSDGIQFPNFKRHMGKSAKKRAVHAKRVSESRASKRTKRAQHLSLSSDSGSSSPPKEEKAFAPKAGFEEFWRAYPRGRKTDKGKARAAWGKAVKKAAALEIISAALEYAQSPLGQGEYVKKPVTWLDGECWNDDRAAWNRTDDSKPSLYGGIQDWAKEKQEPA